jgi:ketosteroid isomerase-like protein
MQSDDDAQLVRRGYAAFSAGDMDTLNGLFADDAVWRVPGHNALSGPKNGRNEVLSFFGELMARTDGTLTVSLQDVIAGADHTVGLHRIQGRRNGRDLEQNAVLVFTLRDGRVLEVQEFHEDTSASDEFWS